MIFLTETKCKIRFICVGFNCKRKKGGLKNVCELCPLRGEGVRRLMEKSILNFHFDYWNISLGIGFCKHHIMTKCRLFLYVSKPNFICLLQDICRSPHGKPHFVRCNGTGRDKPACLTMAPDLLKQI